MYKFFTAIALVAVLSGCASTVALNEQTSTQEAAAEPAEPAGTGQKAQCGPLRQTCTGKYSPSGTCYDGTREKCFSGKVCSFGYSLCEKGGSAYCYDVVSGRC